MIHSAQDTFIHSELCPEIRQHSLQGRAQHTVKYSEMVILSRIKMLLNI